MAKSTKERLLLMAADRIGRQELAQRLAVPESLLEAWMEGVASMPDGKLQTLAEVIRVLGDEG